MQKATRSTRRSTAQYIRRGKNHHDKNPCVFLPFSAAMLHGHTKNIRLACYVYEGIYLLSRLSDHEHSDPNVLSYPPIGLTCNTKEYSSRPAVSFCAIRCGRQTVWQSDDPRQRTRSPSRPDILTQNATPDQQTTPKMIHETHAKARVRGYPHTRKNIHTKPKPFLPVPLCHPRSHNIAKCLCF